MSSDTKEENLTEILGRKRLGFTVEDLIQFLQMTCRTFPAVSKMKLSVPVTEDAWSAVTIVRVDQNEGMVHLDTM